MSNLDANDLLNTLSESGQLSGMSLGNETIKEAYLGNSLFWKPDSASSYDGIKNFNIYGMKWTEGKVFGNSNSSAGLYPTILADRKLFERDNSYEVKIAAFLPSSSTTCIICGSADTYNMYFSIELWRDHVVFIVASNQGVWGSIGRIIQIDCSGKLIHTRVSHDGGTDNFRFSVSDDGVNWNTLIANNLQDVSYASSRNFLIGGIFNHNNSILRINNAYLDMSKSYIMVNGVFQ